MKIDQKKKKRTNSKDWSLTMLFRSALKQPEKNAQIIRWKEDYGLGITVKGQALLDRGIASNIQSTIPKFTVCKNMQRNYHGHRALGSDSKDNQGWKVESYSSYNLLNYTWHEPHSLCSLSPGLLSSPYIVVVWVSQTFFNHWFEGCFQS